MDSRRSACAMGKWAPPLANAIFQIAMTDKYMTGFNFSFFGNVSENFSHSHLLSCQFIYNFWWWKMKVHYLLKHTEVSLTIACEGEINILYLFVFQFSIYTNLNFLELFQEPDSFSFRHSDFLLLPLAVSQAEIQGDKLGISDKLYCSQLWFWRLSLHIWTLGGSKNK